MSITLNTLFIFLFATMRADVSSPYASDGSREQPDSKFSLFFSLFFFLSPLADTARNQLPTIEIDHYRPTVVGDFRNRPLLIDFGW
ncbi:hypothetical protein GW17_00055108 [Ensete ventricosum]|nr:hypothetical protein GW17_00055108 [Ensete ventricosum]